jgi:FAD/FMN-containing dehydrogenase
MPTAPSEFRGPFYTDFATRAAYSEGAGPYRIVPEAVAVPADLDDLRRLVNHAAENRLPLTPRGAGSGIPGNNVGPGIVVDMRSFASPLSIGSDGIANVGAAVTWGALDQAAAALGFRLGPNPSSGHACTIGGMIATNASGARSLRAGSVRRWVRGVEMVTADGEIGWFARGGDRRRRRTPVPGQERTHNPSLAAPQRFEVRARIELNDGATEIRKRFPRTRKNSSGYALDEFLRTGDLLDLIIGSEGTLGIVTRVALQLEPVPAAVSSALLVLDDLQSLPEIVVALQALDPSAIELMDRSLLALAGPRLPFPLEKTQAVLLVDFERDSDAAAADAVRQARSRLEARTARFESALTAQQRQKLWSVRHAASPTLAALPPERRSLQIIEDGCVPPAALGKYLEGVRTAAAKAGIEIVAFGHAGDGHLHVNALADTRDPQMGERLARLLSDVTKLLVMLGGTASGEHGDGRLRAPVLEKVYGKRVMGLFAAVKRAFDPLGIMNPGVILPVANMAGGRPSLSDLKVGAGAQEIPESIERQLRHVEQSGEWNVNKSELVMR